MTHTQLSKGLIYLFKDCLPDRLKKLEGYGSSHTKARAEAYIDSSMELTLGKEKE